MNKAQINFKEIESAKIHSLIRAFKIALQGSVSEDQTHDEGNVTTSFYYDDHSRLNIDTKGEVYIPYGGRDRIRVLEGLFFIELLDLEIKYSDIKYCEEGYSYHMAPHMWW